MRQQKQTEVGDNVNNLSSPAAGSSLSSFLSLFTHCSERLEGWAADTPLDKQGIGLQRNMRTRSMRSKCYSRHCLYSESLGWILQRPRLLGINTYYLLVHYRFGERVRAWRAHHRPDSAYEGAIFHIIVNASR